MRSLAHLTSPLLLSAPLSIDEDYKNSPFRARQAEHARLSRACPLQRAGWRPAEHSPGSARPCRSVLARQCSCANEHCRSARPRQLHKPLTPLYCFRIQYIATRGSQRRFGTFVIPVSHNHLWWNASPVALHCAQSTHPSPARGRSCSCRTRGKGSANFLWWEEPLAAACGGSILLRGSWQTNRDSEYRRVMAPAWNRSRFNYYKRPEPVAFISAVINPATDF